MWTLLRKKTRNDRKEEKYVVKWRNLTRIKVILKRLLPSKSRQNKDLNGYHRNIQLLIVNEWECSPKYITNDYRKMNVNYDWPSNQFLI